MTELRTNFFFLSFCLQSNEQGKGRSVAAFDLPLPTAEAGSEAYKGVFGGKHLGHCGIMKRDNGVQSEPVSIPSRIGSCFFLFGFFFFY